MARSFPVSTDKITTALGAITVFGPGTVAAIIRPVIGANGDLVALGAAPAFVFTLRGTGVLRGTTATSSTGAAVLVSNKWYLVAFTKPTGSNTGRFHIYDYATNTWVHEVGSTAIANSATPATSNALGNSAIGYAGDLEIAAVWDIAMSDSQVESLPFALGPWFQTQPRALWLLDQALTTQAVRDLSGGGAQQSALSGTAVSVNSVPLWTPGQGAMAA